VARVTAGVPLNSTGGRQLLKEIGTTISSPHTLQYQTVLARIPGFT
jgi:hypothetical protein